MSESSEPRQPGRPDPGRVRASDAEREEVADRLRAAMEEGRLSLDEGEQRLAGAYATTYRDELPGLTADLPPVEPPLRDRAGGRWGGQAGPPWGGPEGRAAGPPWGDRVGRSRSGRPRPAVPVVGLVAVAAVLTGIWAAAAGGPLWPVILLGVLAVLLVKHGRHRNWHGSGHPCRRPEG